MRLPALANTVKETLGQGTNVFFALAQWRQTKTNHVEAEEQIAAEGSLLDSHLQIPAGSSNHAHIDWDGFAIALNVKLPFLQGANQLALNIQRHFPNFIKKNCASAGQGKQAVSGFYGTAG